MIFQDIFTSVYEPGDQVVAVGPCPGVAASLGNGVREYPAEAWSSGELPGQQDALFFLDMVPRMNAAQVGGLAARIANLVRPGGLLFLNAWSVDHPEWRNPAPGWEKSGSRELSHAQSGEHRFFLYDDEIITLFAAWNVLHHHEDEEGLIEIVLIKPEGRLVDVSTALYEG
jgi:hypothetical protein